MIITVCVVKEQGSAIALRKPTYRLSEVDAVNRSRQPGVLGAVFVPDRLLLATAVRVIQGDLRQAFLAQMHQNHVEHQPMKPSRKRRFAAEGGNSTEELQESVLPQIFSLAGVARPCANKGSKRAACTC